MEKLLASQNGRGIGRLPESLRQELGGRNRGIMLAAVASLVILLLSLPAVNWIYLVNGGELLGRLKVNEEAISQLAGGYSLFNLLSFVEYSKQGVLGLYSMILLLLITVAVYFHIRLLLKVIFGGRNAKRTLKNHTPDQGAKINLSFYGTAQAAMLFTVLTALAAIGFIFFANGKFGIRGFTLSPVVYVILLLGAVVYIMIKAMEREEWKLCHEHGFLRELKKNWVLFLMLIPAFIYFMINNYLPMLGAYYAFTNFNFRDGLWASPFVGFDNFQFLVKADLLRLTRNTILYNVVFIGLGNILQIIFAVFVSQVTVKWFKKVSQTLMFMPYFVSFVILKVLVYNIFEYNFGLVNSTLMALTGDPTAKIDFYNVPEYWPFLITAFYLWKNIGYGMVVYLATIMGIDSEYYDAAKVDGANIFQQIRYITLPLLTPTFIILLLYALGSIMKGQFELFYQMIGNNGVLYNITDIFDTYVYRITMTQPLSIGLGTAAGLYQSVFGFVIIMLTNFVIKRKNADYSLF